MNECSSTDLELPVIDIPASVKLSTSLNRLELYEDNTASQKCNVSIVLSTGSCVSGGSRIL